MKYSDIITQTFCEEHKFITELKLYLEADMIVKFQHYKQ